MIRYSLKSLAAHFGAGRALFVLSVLGVALGVASVVSIQIITFGFKLCQIFLTQEFKCFFKSRMFIKIFFCVFKFIDQHNRFCFHFSLFFWGTTTKK